MRSLECVIQSLADLKLSCSRGQGPHGEALEGGPWREIMPVADDKRICFSICSSIAWSNNKGLFRGGGSLMNSDKSPLCLSQLPDARQIYFPSFGWGFVRFLQKYKTNVQCLLDVQSLFSLLIHHYQAMAPCDLELGMAPIPSLLHIKHLRCFTDEGKPPRQGIV